VEQKRSLLQEGVGGKVITKDPGHRQRLFRKRIKIVGSTERLLTAAEGVKMMNDPGLLPEKSQKNPQLKKIVNAVVRNLNSLFYS